MIKKLFLSQAEKVGIGFWSLNQSRVSIFFFYLLVLFLPTQLGKHFWPQFSIVYGLRLDYLSPTIYLTDVLIILITGFSFNSIIAFLKKSKRKYLVFYILFLLSLILPLPFSKNPLAGVYGIIKVIEFSTLFIFIVSHYKQFNNKILICLFSIGVVFESSLSTLQYINKGSLQGIFYFFGERNFNAQTPGIANASVNGELILRPYGTFSHPNVLAGYLITAMILILSLAEKLKTNKKIISLVIAIGSISLIFTLSRITLILWAGFLLFLFGTSMAEKYKKTISNSQVVQILISVFFGTIIVLSTLQFIPLYQRFISTRLTDESVVQREYLITESVSMFEKNPLFGVGINNFYNNLSPNYRQDKTIIVQPVHNIFLLSLSQTGIISIIFLIYFIYKMIPFQVDKKFNSKYLVLLFLSLIVNGLFDHYSLTLQQGQLLTVFVFATLISYKYF